MARQAEQLAAGYQRAQTQVTARVAAATARAWAAVDVFAVDATWPAAAPLLAEAVHDAHSTTTRLAAEFLPAHAASEGVLLARRDVVKAPPLRQQQIATVLRVTGPVAFKRAAGSGASALEARDRALVQLTGAVQRLALSGGRSTMYRTIDAHPRVIGWRRRTSGRPCYFCAMLASRGAVYKGRGTAGGDRAYHDHCHCLPEPLYAHEEEPPEVGEFRNLWLDTAAGHTTREQVAAFRRAYEAQA